jgi:hypothetical protein
MENVAWFLCAVAFFVLGVLAITGSYVWFAVCLAANALFIAAGLGGRAWRRRRDG